MIVIGIFNLIFPSIIQSTHEKNKTNQLSWSGWAFCSWRDNRGKRGYILRKKLSFGL